MICTLLCLIVTRCASFDCLVVSKDVVSSLSIFMDLVDRLLAVLLFDFHVVSTALLVLFVHNLRISLSDLVMTQAAWSG